MKATPPPAKRRRGPRLAVLALVFCSLLVPIAFLFNRFPAGEFSAADTFAPTPRDATRLEPPPDSGECGCRRGLTPDRIGAVPGGSVPGARWFLPCRLVCGILGCFGGIPVFLLGIVFFGGQFSDWFGCF